MTGEIRLNIQILNFPINPTSESEIMFFWKTDKLGQKYI